MSQFTGKFDFYDLSNLTFKSEDFLKKSFEVIVDSHKINFDGDVKNLIPYYAYGIYSHAYDKPKDHLIVYLNSKNHFDIMENGFVAAYVKKLLKMCKSKEFSIDNVLSKTKYDIISRKDREIIFNVFVDRVMKDIKKSTPIPFKNDNDITQYALFIVNYFMPDVHIEQVTKKRKELIKFAEKNHNYSPLVDDMILKVQEYDKLAANYKVVK